MHVKIQNIINEIARIAKIKSPEKTQEEVRELDRQINTPKIDIKLRGNYAYCYVYTLEYRKDVKQNRRNYIEKIGKIAKEVFLKNEKEIRSMNYNELKQYKYLEQY